MAPIDPIWLLSILMEELPATPHQPHPLRSVCGIGYTIKQLSKIV